MPLGPEYDKMIDSKFADMKNTGGRHGGSITGGAVPAALRQRHALGPSRHRRHGDGLARQRDQPQLGARDGACACSTGWWPSTTRAERGVAQRRAHHDRRFFLPPRETPLERGPARPSRALPAARLARCRAGAGGAAARRSTTISGPIATRAFLPHGPGRRNDGAAQPIGPRRPATPIRTAPAPASCSTGCRCRRMPALIERIVLLFDGNDEDARRRRARALEGGEGRGLEADLLAAGRERALGEEGPEVAPRAASAALARRFHARGRRSPEPCLLREARRSRRGRPGPRHLARLLGDALEQPGPRQPLVEIGDDRVQSVHRLLDLPDAGPVGRRVPAPCGSARAAARGPGFEALAFDGRREHELLVGIHVAVEGLHRRRRRRAIDGRRRPREDSGRG